MTKARQHRAILQLNGGAFQTGRDRQAFLFGPILLNMGFQAQK